MLRHILRHMLENPWSYVLTIVLAALVSSVVVHFYLKRQFEHSLGERATLERTGAADVKSERMSAKSGDAVLPSATDTQNARATEQSPAPAEKTQTDSPHAHPHIHDNSDSTEKQSLAGTETGMTDEDVQARKQQRKALDKRWATYSEKSRMVSKYVLANVDEELSLMRSIFKLMSPEQAESAKQELLKTESTEEVDAFFAEMSKGSDKTADQITQEAQQIVADREILDIFRGELKKEFAELVQAERELYPGGPEAYEKMYQARAAEIEKQLAAENSPLQRR